MDKTVSAIVPVFDEEKNLEKTIKFLLKNPLISEVICVNDGSSDKSWEIMKNFQNKIRIVNLKRNYGKGKALSEGIKKAEGEIVFFIDADLINFTEKHLKLILLPLFKKEKKAVLGFGTPKRNHFFATRSFVKGNTGQRAYFRKDLMPYLKTMEKKKYGIEIYLNGLFKKEDVKMVPLVKVTHIWKHKKHPPHKAIKQYLKLGSEVAKELGKRELREMTQAVPPYQSYVMPYVNKIHFYSKKVFSYLFEI